MLTSKALTAAVLTVLTGQAVAANSHRHLHRAEIAKRAMHTEWVTVQATVYVTAGQESQPTTVAEAPQQVSQEAVAQAPQAEKQAVAENPVVPEAPVVSVAPVVSQAPAVAPVVAPAPTTTLATSVKPASTTAEPIIEISASIDLPSVPEPSKEPETPSGGSGSGSGSGVSGKRGIAYNDANMANIFAESCESCRWAYSWGSAPGSLEKNIQYIPMLWGDSSPYTDDWDQNCRSALDAGSPAILSFNEPDHPEQSNMSPSQAASAHANLINPYAGQALIGSPAVTNSGDPGMGLEWLQSFMDACKAQDGGCAIDFCAVHWYSEAQYADTLFDHIEKAHEICDNKPIWLTEFAPTGSDADKEDFMKTVIPKLDAVEYLDAYSYFMVSEGNLMSSVSSLSSVGSLYASVA
ncbi:glycoside hydrolase [Emericellopsis atlantica]|uniref:Glycoside hydrolase n=1 Tax=Emericellopsis atlantica TaxID=2614577 RepID=A0A9P8CRX7_9HYPO|nr:glycoside hydrolase [Emericellopsis atlantica]KAG9257459.1 glycoside hydrolase [Emericellopsis atlantica]